MELKRVVVTGLGAITPIGNSVPEFWENLVNGVSGAGPITHFDASLFKTQFACEVKGFDATKYIDRKEARKMDLYNSVGCYYHTLNKGYSYDLRLRTWHLQFHASWFNQADSTGLQES